MVDPAPSSTTASAMTSAVAPGLIDPGARLAVAHDWLVGLRGGELVLDRICQLARQTADPAPLFTMFDTGRPLTPAIDAMPKVVSRLSRHPDAWRRVLLARYPAAVRELSRKLAEEHARTPIDLLISTSSAAVKGIETPPGVPHLCYCHTPARYLWSQRKQYAKGSALRRAGLALFGESLRRWDARTSEHVTAFLANSSHTAHEIRRAYNRDAHVVHPPVRTGFFTPGDESERGEHWLIVTALEPYKRVDLAIDAAVHAGKRLLIAGDGSQLDALRRHASGKDHIEFLGHVRGDALRDLYRRARLMLFPQVEDFGITAVEAQACGCPVVARRKGGALDSVIEGRTGSFFDEPTPDAITAAARACPSNPDACRRNAERFSESAFDDKLAYHARKLLSARAKRSFAGGNRGATG
ncbi:MAG: glycosyltransferase [Phycisphaerales bacterium]